jgi:L,D-transpeptidase ErfK/SrfK
MKKRMLTIYTAFFALLSFYSSTIYALTFTLPPAANNVIGHVQKVVADEGDDFHTLGRRYDVGYYALIEANPDVNPDKIDEGTLIVVPTRFILPNAPHKGIIINLPELRLYYFPPGKNEVWIFPIGIGRQGWLTPTVVTTIIGKKEKPTWVVPASIKADRASQGVQLPDKVLPGPENPLGDYALRLGLPTYLIHGTNDPVGVGRRSSSGCVRMFPEDIEALFKAVKVGTQVRVMNEPYKIGWDHEKLYLEAHLPLQEQQAELADLTPVAQMILNATHDNKDVVNWDKVDRMVECQSGIPHCIQKPSKPLEKEAIGAEKST